MPYDDEDPPYIEPDPELNELSRLVIGAALEVHKQLGPGLPEAMYQDAMRIELTNRDIAFQPKFRVHVDYKGHSLGYCEIDLLVEGRLVVELKAIETLGPVQTAQVITYLRIIKQKLGLLINFNVAVLRHGIKRVILS